MHLADGVASNLPLIAGLNLLGACGVGSALARSLGADRRRVAYTGTLAAFVLAAQAINVPVVPGASAHVIGTGLLTLAVGPAHAIVAMTAVLLAQALLFADGGLIVLGINALNLAIIPALCVHALRRLFGESATGLGLAAALGTLLGSAAGAASLWAVLVLGAAAPAALTFGWLVGVQSLAGLGEGVLTAVAVRSLRARAPDLLCSRAERASDAPPALDEPAPAAPAGRSGLRVMAYAVAVALVLMPFASSVPDALEVVVAHLQGAR